MSIEPFTCPGCDARYTTANGPDAPPIEHREGCTLPLGVEYLGPKRWTMFITSGPGENLRVGPTWPTKAAARHQAGLLAHLPWEHLHLTVDNALAMGQQSEPICTVPRTELVSLAGRLETAERELRAHKSLVLDLNDEIVARFGHGGALELERRRA